MFLFLPKPLLKQGKVWKERMLSFVITPFLLLPRTFAWKQALGCFGVGCSCFSYLSWCHYSLLYHSPPPPARAQSFTERRGSDVDELLTDKAFILTFSNRKGRQMLRLPQKWYTFINLKFNQSEFSILYSVLIATYTLYIVVVVFSFFYFQMEQLQIFRGSYVLTLLTLYDKKSFKKKVGRRVLDGCLIPCRWQNMLPNVKDLQTIRSNCLVNSIRYHILWFQWCIWISVWKNCQNMKSLDMQKLKWLYVKAESFCISE